MYNKHFKHNNKPLLKQNIKYKLELTNYGLKEFIKIMSSLL